MRQRHAPDRGLARWGAMAALVLSAVIATGAPALAAGCAWTVSPSQNPSASYNYLYAVAAPSPSDVWAVGDANLQIGQQNVPRTLIEHWDGSAWSTVPSPNVGSTAANVLYGVAAAGKDVWAVGYSRENNFAPDQTLTLRWHRGTWKVVRSPNPRATDTLFGVSARAANDVWAVGISSGKTLVLHWDGSSWSRRPSESPDVSVLYSVAANPAGSPVAVGDLTGGKTLVEQWDGSSWKVVPSQDPSSTQNDLLGVAADRNGDVWGVGRWSNPASSAFDDTLAEHPAGASWVTAPSPSPGATINTLSAVAGFSPTRFLAVGGWVSDGRGHTLIESWDGSAWTTVRSPDPGTIQNELRGVTYASRSDAWAVGDEQGPTAAVQTLILHRACAP